MNLTLLCRLVVNASLGAAARLVGLLRWLCVFGALACTKDAASTSRSKTEPVQLAPARAKADTVASDAVVPSSSSSHRAPTQTPPGALAVPSHPVETAYPPHLFAPFEQRFSENRTDPFGGYDFQVRFAPGQQWLRVSSCDALLALPLTDRPSLDLEPPTESELKGFWSTAVDCLALRLARAAKPAQRSHMAVLLSSKDPGHLLPPLLGMVDFDDERKEAQTAAVQCQSWKNYDRSVRITKRSPARFAIRGADWSGELEFYARGDIDGDGDEDVLVRRSGDAEGGSYGGTALFVLSQTDRDPCIRVARELGSS